MALVNLSLAKGGVSVATAKAKSTLSADKVQMVYTFLATRGLVVASGE
jgi:hypothetical protein